MVSINYQREKENKKHIKICSSSLIVWLRTSRNKYSVPHAIDAFSTADTSICSRHVDCMWCQPGNHTPSSSAALSGDFSKRSLALAMTGSIVFLCSLWIPPREAGRSFIHRRDRHSRGRVAWFFGSQRGHHSKQ